ncbi:hypothetical protein Efla_003140 [Eimeria flavescens]
MERLRKELSGRPVKAILPGTRPLTIEEYECLETTHPYTVKQLVASKGRGLPIWWNGARPISKQAQAHLHFPNILNLDKQDKAYSKGSLPQQGATTTKSVERAKQPKKAERQESAMERRSSTPPPLMHVSEGHAGLRSSSKMPLAATEAGAGGTKGGTPCGTAGSERLHVSGRFLERPCAVECSMRVSYSGCGGLYTSQLRRGSAGRGSRGHDEYADDAGWNKAGHSNSCKGRVGSKRSGVDCRRHSTAPRFSSASPRLTAEGGRFTRSLGRLEMSSRLSLPRSERLPRNLQAGTFAGYAPSSEAIQRTSRIREALTLSESSPVGVTKRSAVPPVSSQLTPGSRWEGESSQQRILKTDREPSHLRVHGSPRRYESKCRVAGNNDVGDFSLSSGRLQWTQLMEDSTHSERLRRSSAEQQAVSRRSSAATYMGRHRLKEHARGQRSATPRDVSYRRQQQKGTSSSIQSGHTSGVHAGKLSLAYEGSQGSFRVPDNLSLSGKEGTGNSTAAYKLSVEHGGRIVEAQERGHAADRHSTIRPHERESGLQCLERSSKESGRQQGATGRRADEAGSGLQPRDIGEESSMHLRGIFASHRESRGSVGGIVDSNERALSMMRRTGSGTANSEGRRSSEENPTKEGSHTGHISKNDSLNHGTTSIRRSLGSNAERFESFSGGSRSGVVASSRQGYASWNTADKGKQRSVGDNGMATDPKPTNSTSLEAGGEAFRRSGGSAAKQSVSSSHGRSAVEEETRRRFAIRIASRMDTRESTLSRHQLATTDEASFKSGSRASARLSGKASGSSMGLASRFTERLNESKSRPYRMESGVQCLDYSGKGCSRRQGSTGTRVDEPGSERDHTDIGEESSMHSRGAFASHSEGKGSVGGSLDSNEKASSIIKESVSSESSKDDRSTYAILKSEEGSKRSERYPTDPGSHSSQSSKTLEQMSGSGSQGGQGAIRRQGSASSKADDGGRRRSIGDNEKAADLKSTDGAFLDGGGDAFGISNGSAAKHCDSSSHGRSAVEEDAGRQARIQSGSRMEGKQSMSGHQVEAEDGGPSLKCGSNAPARLEGRSSGSSLGLFTRPTERLEESESRPYERGSGSRCLGHSSNSSGRRQGSTVRRVDEGGSERQGRDIGEELSMHLRGAFASKGGSRGSVRRSVGSNQRASSVMRGSVSSGSSGKDRSTYGILSSEEGSKRSGRYPTKQGSHSSQISKSDSLTYDGTRRSSASAAKTVKEWSGSGSQLREGATPRQGSASWKADDGGRRRSIGDDEKAVDLNSADGALLDGGGEAFRRSSGSAAKQRVSSSHGRSAVEEDAGRQARIQSGSRMEGKQSMSGHQVEAEDGGPSLKSGSKAPARLEGRPRGSSVGLFTRPTERLEESESRPYERGSGSRCLGHSSNSSGRRQGSTGRRVDEAGSERHDNDIKEESIMHLRGAFASKGGSKGSVGGSVGSNERASSVMRGSVSSGSSGKDRSTHGTLNSEEGSKRSGRIEVSHSSQINKSDSLSHGEASTRRSCGSAGKTLKQLSGSGSQLGQGAISRQGSASSKADDEGRRRSIGNNETAADLKSTDGASLDGGGEAFRRSNGSAAKQRVSSSHGRSAVEEDAGRQARIGRGSCMGNRESTSGYHIKTNKGPSLSGGSNASARLEGRSSGSSVGLCTRPTERLEESESRPYGRGSGSQCLEHSSNSSGRRQGSTGRRVDEAGSERQDDDIKEDSSMHLRGAFASKGGSRGSVGGSVGLNERASSVVGGCVSSGSSSNDWSTYGTLNSEKRSERRGRYPTKEGSHSSQISNSDSLRNGEASTRRSLASAAEKSESFGGGSQLGELAIRRQGSASWRTDDGGRRWSVRDDETAADLKSTESMFLVGEGEAFRRSNGFAAMQSVSSSHGGSATEKETARQSAIGSASSMGEKESTLSGQQVEADGGPSLNGGSSASARLSGRSSGSSVGFLLRPTERLEESESRPYGRGSGSQCLGHSSNSSGRRQGSTGRRVDEAGSERQDDDIKEESSMHLRGAFASKGGSKGSVGGSVGSNERASSVMRGSVSSGSSSNERSTYGTLHSEEESKGSGRYLTREGYSHSSQISKSDSLSHGGALTRGSLGWNAETFESFTGGSQLGEGASRRKGSASWKADDKGRRQSVEDDETAANLKSANNASLSGEAGAFRTSSGSAAKQSVSSSRGRSTVEEAAGRQANSESGSSMGRNQGVSGHQVEADEGPRLNSGSIASARLSERSSGSSMELACKPTETSQESESHARGSGLQCLERSSEVSSHRQGSRGRQVHEAGSERHDGDIGEESSMHLRGVFASQSEGKRSSAGSVGLSERSSGVVRGSMSSGSSGKDMSTCGTSKLDEGTKRCMTEEERSGFNLRDMGSMGSSLRSLGKGIAPESVIATSVAISKGGSQKRENERLRSTAEDESIVQSLSISGSVKSCETTSLPLTNSMEKCYSKASASSKVSRAADDIGDGTVLNVTNSIQTQKDQGFKRYSSRGSFPPDPVEAAETKSCKETYVDSFQLQLSEGSRGRPARTTPVAYKGSPTPRLGISRTSMIESNGREQGLTSSTRRRAGEYGDTMLEKTSVDFSESSALDNLAHRSCKSPDMLLSVLNSAMASDKPVRASGDFAANKPNAQLSNHQDGMLVGGQFDLHHYSTYNRSSDGQTTSTSGSSKTNGLAHNEAPCKSLASYSEDNAAGNVGSHSSTVSEKESFHCHPEGGSNVRTRSDLSEEFSSAGSSACPFKQSRTGDSQPSRIRAEDLVQRSSKSATRQLKESTSAGLSASLAIFSSEAQSSSRGMVASFCTAASNDSSFARLGTTPPEANRRSTHDGKTASGLMADSCAHKADAFDSLATSTRSSASSRRRRNSTGDMQSGRLGPAGSCRQMNATTQDTRRPRGSSSHMAMNSRPSGIEGTAIGRRLTAQSNMWSRVGNYEPLSSSVFHGVFPTLSAELQALCMRCFGTTDSPELRALTDIQKAAMALVAKQSVPKSAAARSRLVKEFRQKGLPEEALEHLERSLLTSVPILIYFDIASLTPHLAQGGNYRSHFEIPQTDATYLRKCNEREQALYSGLYEHESVRPEHHPKYGYVSLNCVIEPPWEPQSGEGCLILKDHVRVRTTISASPQGAESTLHSDEESRVATLNSPWHVLEALGCEALVALAATAQSPSSSSALEISGLIDCNVHGEVKLGKDVDAIVVPKCSAHDKAMLSKLQSIATRYMVPLLSMEKFPRAVKDESLKHVLRHLQHDVLLRKTCLGNTYGQI